MSDRNVWPALGSETLPWKLDESAAMSRTAGRRASGSYKAAVVPEIAKRVVERQTEARLVAKREQVARLAEMRRQELEADFEIWVAELDDTEKRRRLSGTPFAEQPNSKLARTMLREEFFKEQGEI